MCCSGASAAASGYSRLSDIRTALAANWMIKRGTSSQYSMHCAKKRCSRCWHCSRIWNRHRLRRSMHRLCMPFWSASAHRTALLRVRSCMRTPDGCKRRKNIASCGRFSCRRWSSLPGCRAMQKWKPMRLSRCSAWCSQNMMSEPFRFLWIA